MTTPPLFTVPELELDELELLVVLDEELVEELDEELLDELELLEELETGEPPQEARRNISVTQTRL